MYCSVTILVTTLQSYDIIEAQEHNIDLLLKDKKKEEYLVCEIKYNTVFTDNRIEFISERLKEKRLFIEKKYKKVKSAIIFPGILSQKYMDFLKTSGIEIWDKDYLVSQFKEEMLQIDNPYINSLFRIFGAKTKQTKNIYKEKIDKLKNCKPGRENCFNYQRLVGEILELLFCPDLCAPISEKSDYKKINRRDYVMPNYEQNGFWNFMRQNYSAHIVVIDAKNSNVGVKKQDILQMANYLNKHRSRLIWNYYC